MVRGRCKGGPRDNVIIEANPGWDGLVRKNKVAFGEKFYYPGKYLWDYDKNIWVWFPIETELRISARKKQYK